GSYRRGRRLAVVAGIPLPAIEPHFNQIPVCPLVEDVLAYRNPLLRPRAGAGPRSHPRARRVALGIEPPTSAVRPNPAEIAGGPQVEAIGSDCTPGLYPGHGSGRGRPRHARWGTVVVDVPLFAVKPQLDEMSVGATVEQVLANRDAWLRPLDERRCRGHRSVAGLSMIVCVPTDPRRGDGPRAAPKSPS